MIIKKIKQNRKEMKKEVITNNKILFLSDETEWTQKSINM